jgi:hypothetical protein
MIFSPCFLTHKIRIRIMELFWQGILMINETMYTKSLAQKLHSQHAHLNLRRCKGNIIKHCYFNSLSNLTLHTSPSSYSLLSKGKKGRFVCNFQEKERGTKAKWLPLATWEPLGGEQRSTLTTTTHEMWHLLNSFALTTTEPVASKHVCEKRWQNWVY